MNKKNYSGFTLIELILVIVILGILGSLIFAKFTSLKKDSEIVKVKAIARAFQEGVRLIHAKWIVSGASSCVENIVDDIDVKNGWPIGVNGCVFAWQDCDDILTSVLEFSPTAGYSTTKQYKGEEFKTRKVNETCEYWLASDETLKFVYNPSDGSVVLLFK
ncbi:type II secretion system protein [Deferribacter autotrophicus]|uniref:Type II secretion system protein n=1 Tax=Deferribacter autotrophicus TaxID=500465 RepID=A0A5A8F066_9BACT|nr:type II secretion system protein [Deferribacter autotrophicus]KAA0257366.1 type II secretion system protein [Deferribacter autotrophicus]